MRNEQEDERFANGFVGERQRPMEEIKATTKSQHDKEEEEITILEMRWTRPFKKLV